MTTTKQSTWGATLRTTLLLATLSGLLVVIGFAIGGAQTAFLFLLLAAGMNFFSYFFSDKLALKILEGEFTEGDSVLIDATDGELTFTRK